MRRYRSLAVVSAAVFLGFAAFGATQEWSETKEFTATETIEDEVVLNGEVAVTVASGKTVTLSSWVHDGTSAGKIKLLGGGTLVLAHTNDFTGGAYIDTGVLQVLTGGALGTGDITIKGSSKKNVQSMLQFGLLDEGVSGNKTVIFSNGITIENSGSTSNFQLKFGPHLTDTTQSSNRKSLNLTGNISAAGKKLYFSLGNGWNSASQPLCYLNGSITAESLYFDRIGLRVYIYGQLDVGLLHSGNSGQYSVTLYNSDNCILTNRLGAQSTVCGAANVLGGMAWIPKSPNSIATKTNNNNIASLSLKSYNQEIAYIQDEGYTIEAHKAFLPYVSGSAVTTTLTLTGGVDHALFQGKLGTTDANGLFSMKLNPADANFVQAFSNNIHTIAGTITVENGTMAFGGNTTLANLTGITVNGGMFVLDTTNVGEVPTLKKLNALTVMNGAKLTLKGANLFKDDMSLTLTLESGSQIDIPAGTFNVSSLTVDGRRWAAGEYTRAMLPMLPEGVMLNVTAGSWGTETVSVDWTGAGADNATTTAENWSDDAPLKTGATYATLTGGDGMDYDDGDWLNRIVNDITPDAENKVAPFVIRPTSTNESATLHLTKGINSDEKTQLVLSGHLTDLPENSTASDNRIYYTPSTVIDGVQDAIQPTCKTANGVLPLVLKDVTLDMPLNITGLKSRHASQVVMMSYLNTTNVIKGPATIKGYTFYLAAEADSVIRFLGGLVSDNNLCYFRGAGEYEIHDKLTMNIGTEIYDGCTLSLNTTNSCGVLGKDKREGIVMKGGTLNMLNDNVLRDTLQVAFDGGVNVIELNATTQTVGVIYNNGTVRDTDQSCLHGDYPALLKVTGKHRETTWLSVLKPTFWNARITGGLSIHFTGEGTNEVFTLAGRAFESCGDLMVSAKTLELASDATWLNGTNFTASGEGTLKFNGNNQVSKDFAQLHIAGNGKVEIPEGVTVQVSAADLDGTAVENGSYKTGDEGISAHITGAGTLKVGKRGTMFILQ